MNTGENILNKVIAIAVIALVLFWFYKNMQDNAFKKWVNETIQDIREALKNGR